jgi:hypothetical protein
LQLAYALSVLDVVEEQNPELIREATPSWWTEALAHASAKASKTALKIADLPAITIGEHALGSDHLMELLGALQASTLEKPHPLLRPLREHTVRRRRRSLRRKLI